MLGESLNPKPQQSAKSPQFLIYREGWARGFFSRLKEYLSERPVKVSKNAPGALGAASFGAGLGENLRELFAATPKWARQAPDGRMLVAWKPWYRGLWDNIRDTVAPRRLPPLKLESQPVKVREIWSRNEGFKRAQAVSWVAHLAIIILILAPFIGRMPPAISADNRQFVEVDIGDYKLTMPAGGEKPSGGGGGGERNPVPATRGKLPRFMMKQLTPPVAAIKNPNPALPVEPTLIGPPEIKVPSSNLRNYGDPLAQLFTGSGGPGKGGGIGTGEGGGIGSGSGGGLGPGSGGGFGGGVFKPGAGGVGYPACAYCPDPKFSDEARKAKYQGTVVILAIITPEGKATNVRVIRGLGLGLDEKAIEAVRTWVFRPAVGPGGRPVAVEVPIEVTFRLL